MSKTELKNELIVDSNPKSIISEGIKTLRTNIQFADIDNTMKSILFTSTVPGEGKSFIAANLAVAFGQTGKKVLLVDADLRKGRQHVIFNIKNERGLSNLLIDDIRINAQNYIKKTTVPNVSIITMGTVPPNPSELLNSEKCKELIKILEYNYDLVIIDCVPVTGLTDALIMSTQVDKTVIVSAIKFTPADGLAAAKKQLVGVGANLAGVIINKVPMEKSTYYNKYYSRYY